MEFLKDKQKRTDYDAMSRYAPFPYYYHTEDERFIYGLTSHLSVNSEYVAHKVKESDTLENLALKYYGRPDFYWIIADFNRVLDPFINLVDKYDVIRIPSLGQVYFEVRQ